MGISPEQFQVLMESMSHTRRSTTLAKLGNVAVFLASEHFKIGGTPARADGSAPRSRAQISKVSAQFSSEPVRHSPTVSSSGGEVRP
jgi:hypothetical protein